VAGSLKGFKDLLLLSNLELDQSYSELSLESENLGVGEVVLSPRSSLIGKNLLDIDFHKKYGVQVLAIWREGRPIRSRVREAELCFGDALLLHGPREKLELLCDDSDFLVVSSAFRRSKYTKKAPFAVISLLITMLLSAFQILPVHIAAFIAAVFVVLSGAITMQDGYKAVEWRIVVLVALLIPLGDAVSASPSVKLIGDLFSYVESVCGSYGLLIVVSLLASLFSQLLDGSLAIILITPLVITFSHSLGLSPLPYLMATALSASVAFLTPFSHKVNLLVMGAGGYKAKHYFKVGLPLTIITFCVMWLVVPIVFPFR